MPTDIEIGSSSNPQQPPHCGNNELEKQQKTTSQKAIRKTFKGTANLANLLPTGSVLIFQFLSPILTNNGKCSHQNNPFVYFLTLVLLTFCGASCFVMSFTDSVRDSNGKVRYGIATFKGLWVIDGSVTPSVKESTKYRIVFIDFIRAILSVLVFVAVAMFDQNVMKCFVPKPSEETKEKLLQVPTEIGVVCSFLFAVFRSKRQGIGFASLSQIIPPHDAKEMVLPLSQIIPPHDR